MEADLGRRTTLFYQSPRTASLQSLEFAICRPLPATTSQHRSQGSVPARAWEPAAPQEERSPMWNRLTAPGLCRHAIRIIQQAFSNWSWPRAASSISLRTSCALGQPSSAISRCRQQRAKPPSIFNHGGIHPFPISRRSWSSSFSPVAGD